MAAAYGQRSVVSVLLQAKADSCAVDSQGRVAARYAERNGHQELAELLDDVRLEAGDFELADLGRMAARGVNDVASSVRSAFEGLSRTRGGSRGQLLKPRNVFGEETEPAGYKPPEPVSHEAPLDPALQSLRRIEQQVLSLESQVQHLRDRTASGGSQRPPAQLGASEAS